MPDYIEQHSYDHLDFGIEDYRVPGKHFMPDLATGRFHVWVNGGGVGYTDTIEEARSKMRKVAKDWLQRERDQAILKLAGMIESLAAIDKEEQEANGERE